MMRGISGITGLTVVLVCVGGLTFAGSKADLRLHLPRTVSVDEQSLTLGGLGVIRGEDPVLVAKASGIAMGRSPWSKETIVIDRQTILSRLASEGIGAQDVQITGAEKVAVMREEEIIEAKRLVQLAESFLERTRPGPAGCSWRLGPQPKDLAVESAKDLQLKPRLAPEGPKGCLKVEIVAASGQRELGVGAVLFKLLYPAPKAVAVQDIPAGGSITPQNTSIRTVGLEQEPREDWTAPYGMVAAQAIAAGAEIRPGLVKGKELAILVRRNQTIQMRIEDFGFVITATGKALQDGRAGEWIKVQNIDSDRIITARVGFDGTVRPTYEKR